MLFNSLQFAIFLPSVVAGYFLLPHRYRWAFLLAASYFFYMSWRPEYLLLIVASTLVDYLVSLRLGSESRPAYRRGLLGLSLLVNVGLLVSFKYAAFFGRSLHFLLYGTEIDHAWPLLNVLLPVGISFYTFQTLGYTIDVYRGKIKPERHLGIFALFVSFFPQLVAGPIERAESLLPQFHRRHTPDYERMVSGLQLLAWGLFKKVVIADRLALLVNEVYGNAFHYTGLPLILATYAFSFQIYCDFSGYSDMAIGAARILGFDLMRNFRQPYYALSIPEFWRRWHISLSTWFRDYLYLPLGGRRVSPSRRSLNLLIVFAVSGLWHGAGWTFVVWGLLHGVLMVLAVLWERVVTEIRLPVSIPPALSRGIKLAVNFNLVSFSWIFFRAGSLPEAGHIVTHLFTDLGPRLLLQNAVPHLRYELAVAFAAILLMELVHYVEANYGSVRLLLRRQPVWVRWPLYYSLVLAILMFGSFGLTEFIYFQF